MLIRISHLPTSCIYQSIKSIFFVKSSVIIYRPIFIGIMPREVLRYFIK